MDFLSYMTLWERGDESIVQDVPCDCIVTNSTSLVRKAIPFIDVYQQAFCYLDNDDAGRDAFWKIWSAIGGRAYDMSGRYLGSNDLNDALMYNLPSGLV